MSAEWEKEFVLQLFKLGYKDLTELFNGHHIGV